MKFFFVLLLFSLSLSGSCFAQYGRLEPMEPGHSLWVLRTPAATTDSLRKTGDKMSKKTALCIELVERQLNLVRNGFSLNRIPTMNIQSFISEIKFLESRGVDVSYYLTEYFFYFPKKGSPDNRVNKAY